MWSRTEPREPRDLGDYGWSHAVRAARALLLPFPALARGCFMCLSYQFRFGSCDSAWTERLNRRHCVARPRQSPSEAVHGFWAGASE